ncbi:hypothetical protein PFISCL1PPCAC_6669 [Pristionchus fissidentatus]|uniref:Uncharacterized protein n=1 Tax=Pristionchus fissidentatus TaxID=1538716 RepID=A0AAV5VAX5_9BILA|nr:hypothetical protein PFISCL1PPCAC_6669 [Pristionchus fissidentatus]
MKDMQTESSDVDHHYSINEVEFERETMESINAETEKERDDENEAIDNIIKESLDATTMELKQLRDLCEKQRELINSHSASSAKQNQIIDELRQERDVMKNTVDVLNGQRNRLLEEMNDRNGSNTNNYNSNLHDGGTVLSPVVRQAFFPMKTSILPPPPIPPRLIIPTNSSINPPNTVPIRPILNFDPSVPPPFFPVNTIKSMIP